MSLAFRLPDPRCPIAVPSVREAVLGITAVYGFRNAHSLFFVHAVDTVQDWAALSFAGGKTSPTVSCFPTLSPRLVGLFRGGSGAFGR